MRHFYLLLFLCCSLAARAQQLNYDTTFGSWNAKVHLPWDYYQTSQTYQTIVFFPGWGEVGTDITKLLVAGPHRYMANGWNGNVLVGTDSVKFIIVSLQPPTSFPGESNINSRLASIKALYRDKPGAFHLTGLSHGGWCATTFVTGDASGPPYAYAGQIASVVEVQGMVPDDNAPYPDKFDNFALAGGRLLGFEQTNDFRDIQNRVNRMNSTVAGSAIYKSTSYNGGAHGSWDKYYGGTTAPDNFSLDAITQNIYQWMAREGGASSGNQPPVANAGADQSISLPSGQVTVNGSGSSDPDGNIASWSWTKVSGPASDTIVSPASVSTLIKGLTQGVYRYRLQVTDNSGSTAADTIQITVNAAPVNQPPVANAGPDQTITLPASQVTANGSSSSDPDGSITSYSWTKVSGPASDTIVFPSSVSTLIKGLTQGVYRYRLQVTDNQGASRSDTIQITVNAAAVCNLNYDTSFAGWNAKVHLPPNYCNTTDSFQCIVFFPGAAQAGTGLAGLSVYGPHAYLAAGWDGGVTIGSGTVYPIIISLEQVPDFVLDESSTNAKLQAILNRYRIKRNSLHLTGLGVGAHCAKMFVTGDAYDGTAPYGPFTYAGKIASLVDVQGIVPDDNADWFLKVKNFARAGGRYAGFEQLQEYHRIKQFADSMNAAVPGSGIFTATSFGNQQACCYENWFGASGVTPQNFTLDGISQNIYQWMIKQGDTTTTPPNPPDPPAITANAGADQTIARTKGFTRLSSTGSTTGTNISYTWRRISAVSNQSYGNLISPTRATTDVMILPYTGNGYYDFELSVSDGVNSARDTVRVNISWGELPPQRTTLRFATSADADTIPNCNTGDFIIDGANDGFTIDGKKTDIYINNPLNGAPIGAGKKVLIKAGKYGKIQVIFGNGQVNGTQQQPVIITSYGGQLECTSLNFSNIKNVILTGKYRPDTSGHASYTGHANGNYAFSHGKYGIYVNNSWQSLAGFGLGLEGINDSVEVEFIEIASGNFSGMTIKENNGVHDYNFFRIHDNYIRNIHGEGMYLGSTGGGQQHQMNGWRIYNNRLWDCGNEIIQFNQQGSGNITDHNVFIGSATNWKSPFSDSQDFGSQAAVRNGRNTHRDNIHLGSAEQFINFFSQKHDNIPSNNDTMHYRNNLFLHAKGNIGAYMGGGTPVDNMVVNIDSNFIGGFRFKGNEVFTGDRAVNSQQIFRTHSDVIKFVLKNNVRDNTKTVWYSGFVNPDTSNNTVASISNPQFVNSGFVDTFHFETITRWVDTLYRTWKDEDAVPSGVQAGTAVAYQAGEYVSFLSRIYRSKISNNHQHMPQGVTDEYWELQYWLNGIDTSYVPPMDLRLLPGDPYRSRNMGLIDQYNAPLHLMQQAEVLINKNEAKDFHLSPNPARNSLVVQYNSPATGRLVLKIYDTQGRILRTGVYHKQHFAFTQTLDIAPLLNGVYYLETMIAGEKRIVKMFVKQ